MNLSIDYYSLSTAAPLQKAGDRFYDEHRVLSFLLQSDKIGVPSVEAAEAALRLSGEHGISGSVGLSIL